MSKITKEDVSKSLCHRPNKEEDSGILTGVDWADVQGLP